MSCKHLLPIWLMAPLSRLFQLLLLQKLLLFRTEPFLHLFQ